MIRMFSAWVLLVLALSPFTAPFTTCDFGTLVRQPSHALARSPGRTVELIGIPASNGDATTIGPPVTRTQLERDHAIASYDLRGLEPSCNVLIATRHSLRDSGHVPEGSPPQALALRL
jgi:hypothetical protein